MDQLSSGVAVQHDQLVVANGYLLFDLEDVVQGREGLVGLKVNDANDDDDDDDDDDGGDDDGGDDGGGGDGGGDGGDDGGGDDDGGDDGGGDDGGGDDNARDGDDDDCDENYDYDDGLSKLTSNVYVVT